MHTLSDVPRHVALRGACVSVFLLLPDGLPVLKYRLRDPNRHVLSYSNIVKLTGPLCLLLATDTVPPPACGGRHSTGAGTTCVGGCGLGERWGLKAKRSFKKRS